MSENKKFVVHRKCIANEFVFVVADDQEDAISKVAQGKGDIASDILEFQEYLEPKTWKVEYLCKTPKKN